MVLFYPFKKIWRQVRYPQSSPFYWCWQIGQPLSAMVKLHHLAWRNEYPTYPRILVLTVKLVQLLFWPLRLFELSLRLSKRAASQVIAKTGKRRCRQIAELIYLALRYSLPPKTYYVYDFYYSERRFMAAEFLYDQEATTFLPLLNLDTGQTEVQNKSTFNKLCQQAQLATVPIWAEAHNGHFNLVNQFSTMLPESDLFVKPTMGSKGQSCSRWCYLGNEFYENENGRILKGSELIGELKVASYRQAYLIQPNLVSHSALSDLGATLVSCARIVTVHRENSSIEYFYGVLKIPRHNSITNTHGLISPIDFDTGRLGRAFSYSLICDGFEQHPDNGAQINDRCLPDWHKAISLVLTAHVYFPGYFFLGWDVAFTNNGPLLLETNQCWDVMTMQRGHQLAFGKTRFVELCRERIKAISL